MKRSGQSLPSALNAMPNLLTLSICPSNPKPSARVIIRVASFWLRLEGQARAEYAARFEGLEPVDKVRRLAERLGEGMLFQWAGKDTFVRPTVRAAYEEANPKARSVEYPDADHMLDDRAAADLEAFLAERLALS